MIGTVVKVIIQKAFSLITGKSSVSIERVELEFLIEQALDMLYEENIELIEDDTAEGKRISCFIRHLKNLALDSELFSYYHIDSEYSRDDISDPKTIEDFDGNNPDILVHQRESNENNLLAVKLKKWDNQDIEFDAMQLEAFTSHLYGYDYSYGLLVVLGESRDYCYLRWFENGIEV